MDLKGLGGELASFGRKEDIVRAIAMNGSLREFTSNDTEKDRFAYLDESSRSIKVCRSVACLP